MTFETALTWSWLQCLTAKRAEALTRTYGDLDAALMALSTGMLQALGLSDEGVQRVMERCGSFNVASYAEELESLSVTFLTRDDPRYPSALGMIPDYPLFLYARGDIALLQRQLVAIVGTRRMTAYGQAVTGRIVRRLVEAGVVTVSGLALGIDAEVARETLATGGRTVASLAHGMREIFPPANTALAHDIVAHGGLLLTEYPLDQHPTKFTFPERNRIIAGLARVTIVIEAGERSGALITAKLASDYDREVFAVPGSVLCSASAGCHALIAENRAQLVTSGEEVLEALGIVTAASAGVSPPLPNDPVEAALVVSLRDLPQSVSALSESTELPPASVNTALTSLEIRGIVKHGGDGTWMLSC